jgi:glycosyltransferase involved in cell wall biosynthesis
VTVSEGFAALLAARGAKRVHVIPNGFDPEDYPEDEETENVIAYLGTYYPDRQDLDTAFRALASARELGPTAPFRLRFIGEYGPEVEEGARRAGLQARIEVTGFLAHRSALKAMAQARMLLLAGPREPGTVDPITRGWIPAKAFEYLGARRAILYVGNVHSEVADLIRRSGAGEAVAPGDQVAATAAVRRLLALPRPEMSETSRAFTRRSLAGRLALVLNEASEAGLADLTLQTVPA